MFVLFNDIFNPTPEQLKQRLRLINALLKRSLEKNGKDCGNCKYSLYVQQSPYYDYKTCKLDKSVEISGGSREKHYCDKYEFAGFLEED
jgi:hypothetical protein